MNTPDSHSMIEKPSLATDSAGAQEWTVAIIGNPNTGKSTLFTALTGVHSRSGNYPGVTVEKKLGWFQHEGQKIRVIDLPGTYSLSPRTIDEMVSVDVLLGRQSDVGKIDAAVCIVDASNLERNLYLVSQVLDLGLPTVIVVNMWDVAQSRQIQIDVKELERRLGLPVVPCEANRRKNLDAVRSAMVQSCHATGAPRVELFPPAFRDEVEKLQQSVGESDGTLLPIYLVERLLLDVGGQMEVDLARRDPLRFPQLVTEVRQRLSSAGCRIPSVEAKVRYGWIRKILDGVLTMPLHRPVTLTDQIDRWLTHKIWGLVVFFLIMFAVFQSISTVAEPLMDTVEAGQRLLGEWIGGLLSPGPLRSLLVDGVIAGVGGILVFLPQICLLFFFIALLEDCGYMARAAFLMDKLMTKVGLSGKSFVPLMSSFACAIPGIMATRTIENRRDRLVTILIAPLMSCSARAPVYWLMIAAFFPKISWLGGLLSLQGIMLFVMTFFGAAVAVPIAWLFKRTVFKGETPPFVMELPSYKMPSPRLVTQRVIERAGDFVTQAGTLILATSILIWLASYFPGSHVEQVQIQSKIQQEESKLDADIRRRTELEEISKTEIPAAQNAELTIELEQVNQRLAPLEALYEERNKLSEALLTQSYLGQFGKMIEPAVKPLGWDWRIGVGVIASFPAREVIISTLGTIYSLGGEVDEQNPSLKSALQSATWPDGRPVYSIPVALSIMVFFALCAQCASTLTVIRRETNHWGWAAFTFGYMTALAYVFAWLAYTISSLVIR